ncbi:Histidine utilization repressor [Rubellimicrobium mesophilum DSM 19309]|uniref:Histidine utilization repressor n=1 Tax=Rubellimicrobium mesophilum DSM 19309 TaxID=442562 RepID=A0A017HQ38_9RHOB|nr:GntR family transcriptional regulator [Rubellimicrobium mesophilum]EYD75884.1 Histidine utilization repressor [Rubellimicrobium mesophilum DSM 19309]
MTGPEPKEKAKVWATLAEEARRRIRDREWAPGTTIPNEATLAQEWGVSRVTVSRALGKLAEEGLLDRRRRAGTRVVERPQRAASFEVGLIRDEVERTGRRYGYEMIEAGEHQVPEHVRDRLGITTQPRVMRILARHLSGGEPFAWEERWINGGTVPEALDVDWRHQSPNEWLLHNVAYTWADVSLTAALSGPRSSRALGCEEGSALLMLERTTWLGKWSVTHVAYCYAPGHRMWSRS